MSRVPEPLALTSALLKSEGFRHAFFLRAGGVSPDPWSSLNFAASTGDAVENVRENVRRAASFLEVDADRVYYLSQVHGTGVEVLRGDEDPAEVVRREGDATLSLARGVACGVRSADCGTVLLADRRSGAACAVHAGWRGTVRGVVRAAVAALSSAGARPADLVAAVGPHIEPCCFEVGDDVAQQIAESAGVVEGVIVRPTEGKLHVDLRRVLEIQLVACGITSPAIDHVRGCTVCDGGRFFSYRREGKVSGRMLSAVVPRAP